MCVCVWITLLNSFELIFKHTYLAVYQFNLFKIDFEISHLKLNFNSFVFLFFLDFSFLPAECYVVLLVYRRNHPIACNITIILLSTCSNIKHNLIQCSFLHSIPSIQYRFLPNSSIPVINNSAIFWESDSSWIRDTIVAE